MNTTIQFQLQLNMKSLFVLGFSLIIVSLSEAANPRVYNGWFAREPLRSIVSIKDANHKHVCGGSIIWNEWILTAAHCVANQTNLEVVAGTIDNSNLGETSQLVEVERVVIHNHYGDNDLDNTVNDIALLRLEKPLIFDENVNKIPLIKGNILKEATREKSTSYIAGWGATEDAHSSKKLKLAEVTLLDSGECLRDTPETCQPFNPESQICTGPLDIKTGAGLEDDGGPLIVNNMLAGVINHGERDPWTDPDPCHSSMIYTSVQYQLEWIDRETGGMMSKIGSEAANNSGEENPSTNDRVIFYQVELTLTPVDSVVDETASTGISQSYTLNYRVSWFPENDDLSPWDEDYSDSSIVSPDPNDKEPSEEYQISSGNVIIVTLQFSFTHIENNSYQRNEQDSPIECHCVVRAREAQDSC